MLIGLLSLLITINVFAKEGFSANAPPENLRLAWENTFFLKYSNANPTQTHEGTGSAVIVFKQPQAIYIGLITNKHVVKTAPGNHLSVYKNIKKFNWGSPFIHSYDLFHQGNIVFSRLSSEHDLAFLVLKIPASKANSPQPLPVSSSCNLTPETPMATVGFPATILRLGATPDLNNEDVWKTKRWSTGIYVGQPYQMPNGPVVGTTVDALPGSSGGPVLNHAGEIVGIMSGGIDRNYQGSEISGQLKLHSYMVDCEATRDFINKSWLEFLEKSEPSFP